MSFQESPEVFIETAGMRKPGPPNLRMMLKAEQQVTLELGQPEAGCPPAFQSQRPMIRGKAKLPADLIRFRHMKWNVMCCFSRYK